MSQVEPPHQPRLTTTGLAWTPVGDNKGKIVAAHRAGLRRVMPPARNRKDYDHIPASAREHLEFVWLENVDQALGPCSTVPNSPMRWPPADIQHETNAG